MQLPKDAQVSSWLRDFSDDLQFVGRRVMATAETLNRIDTYQTSIPTGPSPGRVYKRSYPRGVVVFVCELEKGDPDMVAHQPYQAIVMKPQSDYVD